MRLCDIDELPQGSTKAFTVGEGELFVVNYWGAYYGYVNRCPHLNIELNWLPDQFLDDSGELIQCAQHGAQFNIESGECISGPCMGEALTAVAIEIKDGALWLA